MSRTTTGGNRRTILALLVPMGRNHAFRPCKSMRFLLRGYIRRDAARAHHDPNGLPSIMTLTALLAVIASNTMNPSSATWLGSLIQMLSCGG